MKYHAPTRMGRRRATLEERLKILDDRIRKLNERIFALTAKRDDEQAKIDAELELRDRLRADGLKKLGDES